MNAVRRTLAIISLWIPTVTIWVTWAMWRDRLPADLPTHWGSSGPADDVTLGITYFAWIVGVTAVIAVLGSVMLLIPMRGRWAQRAIGGVASGAAAMALGIWLGSTVPSLDVVDPFSVHLGAWVLVVTLAPLHGLVTLALLPFGVRPPVKVNPASSVSAMHLEPGESVAWSHSITSPLFIGTAIFVAALTALITLPQVFGGETAVLGWTLLPMVIAILLVVVLCAFRVTVDWRGLRVTSFLLGIPIKRIPVAEIADVQATVLQPGEWGGRGYRFMPGRSALILGKGPGLVVTMRNEKQFAVSISDPETPASVLLSLIEANLTKRP